MKFVYVGIVFALASVLCTISAAAHPVTQGALQFELHPKYIELRARVAVEEAIVANAFAPPERQASSTTALLAAHGRYLAERLRVSLNGRRLAARVLVAPAVMPSGSALLEYRLRYAVPDSAAASAGVLRLEQDLLNEFEFAPGNPWEATFLVGIARDGRALSTPRLLTRQSPVEFSLAPAAGEKTLSFDAELFGEYAYAGLLHILGGFDHLLFISALVLATVTLWDLIKIVSVFTLAHSLTLALSVLDVLRLRAIVVEPMIALSIVVIAAWNLWRPGSANSNARLLIAFAFGLFHGLGFAGGLLEAMHGMTGAGLALAIIAFSLGVELGHQIVVLPLFAGLRLLAAPGGVRTPRQNAVLRYGSIAILAAGLFYLLQALAVSAVPSLRTAKSSTLFPRTAIASSSCTRNVSAAGRGTPALGSGTLAHPVKATDT